MSRSYKKVRPKKHFVYSVDELMELYSVVRNTVSNWIKEGLRSSDAVLPYVFNGSEVKRFHDARKLSNKKKLRIGEFKCLPCASGVFPEASSLDVSPARLGGFFVSGHCPTCGRWVRKILSETDCNNVLKCKITNISLASLDEVIEPAPARIGNDPQLTQSVICFQNDRILHEWLQFAGRWNEKTISAKLAAIRQFEIFCDGNLFSQVSKNDAARYREHLKFSAEASDADQLSVSTVRHQASHLKSFFEWLIGQKGFRKLDRALPEYFELPKKFDAAALPSNDIPCPTLDEATQMIEGMPVETMKERRDRAMVAIAFLGALRADTITSLHVSHFDFSNRLIIQDSKHSRTKNGKSLRIRFFPLPLIFSGIVLEWKDELVDQGFDEQDALFPDDRILVGKRRTSSSAAILPMSSTHSVTIAFKIASGLIGKRFSPHSAKHCIGRLSLKVCKSPEELKAWSMNMGHENEEITLKYYKRIPDSRIIEIFEDFDLDITENVDDKELMLRYHEHQLDRGTPEFERAMKLVRERQS